MVGPEAEKTGLVRHVSRMFVTAASLTVPYFTVVLRKAYGLGAIAMAGGGFHETAATFSWPTGELGAMGLEGAVRLGYRREIEAIEDTAEQQAYFEERLAELHRNSRALRAATYFELDDVIDPADSRHVVTAILDAAPPPAPRTGKKRPFVDTW
jgi:acetyl-CoA carboxylase carboxyltransferase component